MSNYFLCIASKNTRKNINGIEEAELERNLVANQLWDVGVLDWSGATGTWGAVDTVGVY